MIKKNVFNILGIVTLLFIYTLTGATISWAVYPSKPINLIVPYSAGGVSDTISRIMANVAKKYIDQSITVINRPGGSGTVAIYELTKAKPDGYTLAFASNGETGTTMHVLSTKYTLNDFDFICRVGTLMVSMTSSKHDWKDLKEFVNWAKGRKDEISAGVPGLGTNVRLTGELFAKNAGIKFKVIPFQGSGPVIPAVLGGHVDVGFLNVTEVSPHYKAGKMKVFAVFGEKRSSVLPGVSTAKEQGFDVVGGGTHSIIVPNGVPSDVKAVLGDLMEKIIKDPEFIEGSGRLGYTPLYGDADTAKAFWHGWYENIGSLVKELGVSKKKK